MSWRTAGASATRRFSRGWLRSTVTLTASITVPLDQPRTRDGCIRHLVSQSDPQSTATVTVTAKTPAPVLFVDRELWSNYHTRYETTLNALDLPYDYFARRAAMSHHFTDTLETLSARALGNR